MCLGVGINLRPLGKSEISFLDKWRLDKLITLGLTNLPSYLPFKTLPREKAFPMKDDHIFLPNLLSQGLQIFSKYFSGHQINFLALPNYRYY